MTYYFQEHQWEPYVYNRLNQLIDQFKTSESSNFKTKPYVVFDFDNTSIIGDVEDNLMIYMLDHLLYKMTPEEFEQIIITDIFDMDTNLDEALEHTTPRKLAIDIIQSYTWLWEHYINKDKGERLSLEAIKETGQYKAFQAKLRYYYVNVNGKFTRQAGKPWLTYWFKGYTPEELAILTKDMLKEATNKKAEKHIYSTPKEFLGKAGQISSEFQSGLNYPEELIALYEAFQANGIVTYVVSASPVDVVRTAASEYQFKVPKEQVIGMNYDLDAEGKIKAYMTDGAPITKKNGKTEAIMNLIAPKHENRQPIALFGDSMGDYHMMTELKDVSLNVLFNCLNQDKTKDLKQIAKKQYQSDDANFVVQGRDENAVRLIPNTKTLALGQTELEY